jgi:hypothetical protein
MLNTWYDRLTNVVGRQAASAPLDAMDDRLRDDIGVRRVEAAVDMDLQAVAAASMFPWHRPANACVTG